MESWREAKVLDISRFRHDGRGIASGVTPRPRAGKGKGKGKEKPISRISEEEMESTELLLDKGDAVTLGLSISPFPNTGFCVCHGIEYPHHFTFTPTSHLGKKANKPNDYFVYPHRISYTPLLGAVLPTSKQNYLYTIRDAPVLCNVSPSLLPSLISKHQPPEPQKTYCSSPKETQN